MNFIQKNAVLSLIIALIVGACGGYYGAKAMTHTPSMTFGTGARTGAAGFTRGGATGSTASGGFLSGTVTQIDSGSMTLNTRDGSSHVVVLTPNTSVSKSAKGSLSDVTVGANVLVTGATNSDGSITGTMVQLQNGMRMMPAGPTPN